MAPKYEYAQVGRRFVLLRRLIGGTFTDIGTAKDEHAARDIVAALNACKEKDRKAKGSGDCAGNTGAMADGNGAHKNARVSSGRVERNARR